MLQQDTTTTFLLAPPALNVKTHALFLDLDGTLVTFETDPDAVAAGGALKDLLRALSAALDGALAIVTGRTIESADAVLAGALTNIAGIHGAERRTAMGTTRPASDTSPIAQVRDALRALQADGALDADIEEKGAAIALHYRAHPGAGPEVQRVAHLLARDHGLHIVQGAMVVELTLGVRNKGDAVADFMHEPPFAGRTPIAIGDDITDEDAFRRVNAMNGISVFVGQPRATAAHHHLRDIAAVLDWLKAGVAR